MNSMEKNTHRLNPFLLKLVHHFENLFSRMDDKAYLKLCYKLTFGKALDLDAPKTFNEKLQWLKLYNRKDLYTTLADKYEVKSYIANTLGEKYIIPTLGVWDSFDQIDFDTLPDQFVLKCTHDSGGTVICKDKKHFDINSAKEKINRNLKKNYFYSGREWPYKNIKPRIIAEKYMSDESGSDEFTDYKFYCFDGIVDCVNICLDRNSGTTKYYYFDKDWNLKRLNTRGKAAPQDFTLPKPKCLDEMFGIAALLSKGFPFIRVDLYQSNNQIYFGELTFFPADGFDTGILPEADLYWGNLVNLETVDKSE